MIEAQVLMKRKGPIGGNTLPPPSKPIRKMDSATRE